MSGPRARMRTGRFAALVLLAMGSGVIKPNISTLMGLTYDQQRPGQEKLRTSAFSWFYMAINIGAALSQFLLPAVRDAHGYQAAFLVPAFFMAFALVVFASGKRFYAKEVIGQAKHLAPEEKKERWRIMGQIGSLFLLGTLATTGCASSPTAVSMDWLRSSQISRNWLTSRGAPRRTYSCCLKICMRAGSLDGSCLKQ